MFSRPAVVIFIVVVAEFMAAMQMIRLVGFFATALLLIASSFVGVAVIRWKAAGLFRTTVEAATAPGGVTAAVADRLIGVFAGLLLIAPGFVTSALGLALLFPPVRRAIEPKVMARTTRWSVPFMNRPGPRAGHVVDDQIIDVDLVDDAGSTVPRSDRPEVG
jgi:UPF0716 protein FxsA